MTYNPSRESENAYVNRNLEVNGQLNVGSLDAKFANIGSINFNNHRVNIRPDTELLIGDDSIAAGDLLNTLDFVQTIQSKCGEDFNKCHILSGEEVRQHHMKDRKIVENFNKLKRDAEDFVDFSE